MFSYYKKIKNKKINKDEYFKNKIKKIQAKHMIRFWIYFLVGILTACKQLPKTLSLM